MSVPDMVDKLLAIECSTERLSLALQVGDRVFTHEGEGGAQTSPHLLPAIRRLMQDAGLRFEALQAIAFGRGPGSFTGLRGACAVAQGLGFAAGVKLLPVDTLAVMAQQARERTGASSVLAVLDARMEEVYVGCYNFDSLIRNEYEGQSPISPKNLALGRATVWVTNAFATYAALWPPTLRELPRVDAWPTASAMLKLAPALIEAGQLVDAQQALPLYSRDKVALTTQEREAARAAQPAPKY